MKGSLMKLNRVSTFSGEGQMVINEISKDSIYLINFFKLTNVVLFDQLHKIYPDKASPFVRRVRKAAGLISKLKMAELPKDEHFG